METAAPVRRPLPSWLLGADWLWGIAVTILGGVLRFVRLHVPKGLIPLDEFYYPANALGLLRYGADYMLAKGAKLPALDCSAVAMEPQFAVHPPVAKWLIGSGMRLFGCNAFGWRVASAVVGTATVLLVFLIGRRLFRRPWAGALAALLVALDGLHFVQSRIAMLDIFVTFFITLAIWLLVEDRARTGPFHTGRRPWRIASGVAIGLGIASKWSALAVAPILLVLALAWEWERRRKARALTVAASSPVPAGAPGADDTAVPATVIGDDETAFDAEMPIDPYAPPAADAPVDPYAPPAVEHLDPNGPEVPPAPPWAGDAPAALPVHAAAPPERRWLARQAGVALLVFGLLPVLVYLVSYVPWFAAGEQRYTAPRCVGEITFDGLVNPVNSSVWNRSIWPRDWREFVCYQREIYDFHKNLKVFDDKGKPSHPYLSRAWSWPWMGRPTSHYFNVIETPGRCGEPRKVAALQQASGPSPPASVSPLPSPSSSPTTPATTGPTCKRDAEILGLPNPGLWFPAFWIALPLCVWWALRRRDQTAAALLLLFAPLYLPWLVTTRPLFLFYMTPAVPVLALMVAHLVDRSTSEFRPPQLVATFALMFTSPAVPWIIQRMHEGTTIQLLYKIPALAVAVLVAAGLASLLAYSRTPRALAAAYAAVVILLFAYFYPVLAAVHITDDGPLGWRRHMWLQRDCGREEILLTCWI